MGAELRDDERQVMMNRLLKVFNKMFNHDTAFRPEIAVNCHHNYVAAEHHFGEDVFVTRKGAINAETGRYGIIPGSMGAKSFIIKGSGNAASYQFMFARRGTQNVAHQSETKIHEGRFGKADQRSRMP